MSAGVTVVNQLGQTRAARLSGCDCAPEVPAGRKTRWSNALQCRLRAPVHQASRNLTEHEKTADSPRRSSSTLLTPLRAAAANPTSRPGKASRRKSI